MQNGNWQRGVDEIRPAALVDNFCGGEVGRGDGQLAVGRLGLVDGHCLLQAPVAVERRGAGQGHVEGQVVKVGIVGVGRVGDGVGEAVARRLGVDQARGAVDGLVRRQGVVGRDDHAVVELVVGAAVLRADERLGHVVEVRGTLVCVCSACCVQRLRYADE